MEFATPTTLYPEREQTTPTTYCCTQNVNEEISRHIRMEQYVHDLTIIMNYMYTQKLTNTPIT